MTLYEVLEKIAPDEFPLRCVNNKEILIEPQTIFNVILCFGCEVNQWVKVDIQNPVLAPWYECDVISFSPSTDGGGNLEVCLDWESYMIELYEDYLQFIRRNETEPVIYFDDNITEADKMKSKQQLNEEYGKACSDKEVIDNENVHQD